MLEKHVIYPFSSKKYMFSVNFIFFMNITFVFAIITCLGFLVYGLFNFACALCYFQHLWSYCISAHLSKCPFFTVLPHWNTMLLHGILNNNIMKTPCLPVVIFDYALNPKTYNTNEEL